MAFCLGTARCGCNSFGGTKSCLTKKRNLSVDVVILSVKVGMNTIWNVIWIWLSNPSGMFVSQRTVRRHKKRKQDEGYEYSQAQTEWMMNQVNKLRVYFFWIIGILWSSLLTFSFAHVHVQGNEISATEEVLLNDGKSHVMNHNHNHQLALI